MCGVTGCPKERTTMGFCQAHYKKFRKYGDPLGSAPRKTNVVTEAPGGDAHIHLNGLSGRGVIALVDRCEVDGLVAVGSWYLAKNCYVVANRGSGQGPISMHRHILDAPQGMTVDHINGDKLDNRRANLRLATNRQNSWNMGVRSDSKSGHKGVFWNESKKAWIASITFSTADMDEAVRVRASLEEVLHGEFRREITSCL